jgi:SNF family Na+-dependent transporter
VWQEAAAQILFSLSVGFGSQLVLSSYNKFRNNTFRDSIVVAACNSFTEIYAGFIVFAIVGFIQHETGNDISNVRSCPSSFFCG